MDNQEKGEEEMEAVRKGFGTLSQGLSTLFGFINLFFTTLLWRPFDIFFSGSFPLLTFVAIGIIVICGIISPEISVRSPGLLIGTLITWAIGLVSMICIEVSSYHETKRLIERHRTDDSCQRGISGTLLFEWFLWLDENGLL